MNDIWKTSSQSAGGANCVEVSGPWHKSSYSSMSGDQCVEVAAIPASVKVRDTKDHSRGIMTFSDTAWGAFLAGL